MDTKCKHYARANPPRGENLVKIHFLSIVFFETLHPRQRPDLPSTPTQPPRFSTSLQQLRLGNSLPTSAKLGRLRSPKLGHETEREKHQKFDFLLLLRLSQTHISFNFLRPTSSYFALLQLLLRYRPCLR